MNKSLLNILLCPVCGGQLRLRDGEVKWVEYGDGAREEIESGVVECEGACGREYRVSDYVLSLAEVFPPELAKEAAYWDRYYGWLLEQGSLGFHDLRLGQAPYITMGVTEPFPEAGTIDRYTVHHEVAEHPLLRRGKRLLDIGVGLGWTSLYFARAGYEATAIEPSSGPAIAAKRHAMGEGVFVEYVCAALGFVAFRRGAFDNVTAFHSLHHVPNLKQELGKLQEWLIGGGALAIDEHVGNSKLAAAFGAEIQGWAETEVLPAYRTIPDDVLARLPEEPHSEMEDSSVEEVAPLVSRMFKVHLSRPRHVFLDHYPLLYYLHTGRDLAGYRHALQIANHLQESARRVDPEGGDYLTIVAENVGKMQNAEFGMQNAAGSGQEVSAAGPAASRPQPATTSISEVSAGELTSAQERVAELERQLAEQGEWARSLERELWLHQELIGRIEKGRLMRLLRRVTRRRR